MDPNTTDSAGAAPVVKKERKPLKKPVNSEAVAFDPLQAERKIQEEQERKKQQEEQRIMKQMQQEQEQYRQECLKEHGYDPFLQNGYRWVSDYKNPDGGEWVWEGTDNWEDYADEPVNVSKENGVIQNIQKVSSAPASTTASKDKPKKVPPPPPRQKTPERIRKLREEGQSLEESKNKPEAASKKMTIEPHYTLQELVEYEKENLDQLSKEEYIKVDAEREPVNIVFIGHVDAGQSTLSGRILKDTGEVKEEDIRKFEETAKLLHRESWVYAYIMDTDDEERSKGITVECGKANFNLKKKRYTLIDAPGHKNYVPNMIMGACQADVAGLIISSKSGEFEAGFEKGGQTREHAHLAKALGVEKLICIVTKMDTNNWSEERFKYIKEQVHPWLEKACGYTNITWVPIDGYGGLNMTERIDEKICSWYKGKSLFEIFDDIVITERKTDNIRMPILDKQKEAGGLYLSGKMESGYMKVGMNLAIMPTKQQIQVVNIFNTKDQKMLFAGPGENLKIQVKGIEEGDVDRGYMVTNTDNFCIVAREFIAEITLLQLPEHKQIMSDGYTCVMHLHTSVEEISVVQVEALYEAETKQFNKSTFLKSGDTGMVRIQTRGNSLCMEKYETIEQLGRFTLRDEGVTLGYGKIHQIKPIKL